MDQNWKVVRNRACVRAMMIFIGVVLMQLLAYMVCVVVLTAQVMLFDRQNVELMQKLAKANTQDGTFMILVSFVSAALSLIWCGILYKKSSWREKGFDYKEAFGVKNTCSILGIGIGGCIILTMALSLVANFIPAAFSNYNNVMKNLTDSSVLLTMVYVLLIGPVSEEFIFRGAILDRFYLAFPYMLANIIQAALFGIYHMNIVQGLYAFCLGMVLGLIRSATGSIFACILTHIVFNASSYGLEWLFPTANKNQIWLMAFITVLGIVIFAIGLHHIVKIYKEKQMENM